MTIVLRAGIGLTVIAQLVGTVFVCAALYYCVQVVLDQGNPHGNEYWMGISLGLLYGAGAFFLASVLAGALRNHVSRRAFRWLCWPGLAVGGVVFVLYLASIVVSLYGRT